MDPPAGGPLSPGSRGAALVFASLLSISPATADVILSEDFNTDYGGFTVTMEGGHTDPWAHDAVAGAWSTDGSAIGTPNQHTRLTSPQFTATSPGNYILFFDHRYDIEGGNWDGGALFLSVNGAAFNYVPDTEFSENGYNTGALIGAHALNGLTAFGGISDGHATGNYITSTAGPFPLNAGDTVQIQFLMANDEFSVGTSIPNWEIDEVLMVTLDDTDGDGIPDFHEDENGLGPNKRNSASKLVSRTGCGVAPSDCRATSYQFALPSMPSLIVSQDLLVFVLASVIKVVRLAAAPSPDTHVILQQVRILSSGLCRLRVTGYTPLG